MKKSKKLKFLCVKILTINLTVFSLTSCLTSGASSTSSPSSTSGNGAQTNPEPTPIPTPAPMPSSGNAAKDVLAHYADILAIAGLRINTVGDEPLHATYTIGMGLGMRESSGHYCEGYDVAAGTDRTSAELYKLYEEYQADESRCMLDTFKAGVSCDSMLLQVQALINSNPNAAYAEIF